MESIPDLLAWDKPCGLSSVDDSPPKDQGGSIARSGFAFQDEVAVSFLIDMLLDPRLLKIHCETHDDLVLVHDGDAGRCAEFIQVKSGQDGKLWSVSDICKPIGTRSIFEASLCRDSYSEHSRFRLVTTQRVDARLKILTYPRGSATRHPDGENHRALLSSISHIHGKIRSPKGNGAAYWIENCIWEVRHSHEAVKVSNTLKLLRLGEHEGRFITPDDVDKISQDLLMIIKTASEANWAVNPQSKIIMRDDITHCWYRNVLCHNKRRLPLVTAPSSSGRRGDTTTSVTKRFGIDVAPKNIYLDVFNIDYRRIFRWDALLTGPKQVDVLLEILAVGVFLCRDYCIMPPRFVLECPRVRKVVKLTRPYFESALVRWPMRERDPKDFWEKKKRKMTDAWKDYPHMLDQTAFQQLNACARALTRYKPKVGMTVAREWSEAPDNPMAWQAIKQNAPAKFIDQIRHIPGRLVENGMGVTLPAIERHLPITAGYKELLKPVLAASYSRVYIDDMGLVVMTGIPYCGDDLGLGSKERYYDFEVLEAALRPMGLWPLHHRFMAEELVALRSTGGYAHFMQAYSVAATIDAHSVRRAFATAANGRRSPFFGPVVVRPATLVEDASDWMSEVAERALVDLGEFALS